MSTASASHSGDLGEGIRKRLIQVGLTTAFQGLVLFLAAGRLDWTWAWVFIGLYLAGIAANAAFMLRYSPETIAERASSQGMKNWDRIIGGLWAIIYFVGLLAVAGLDARFGWTGSQPLPIHLAGGLIFMLGLGLFSWAMLANAHFSTVARVQNELGQTLCDRGPYRVVRHPGYVGAILQSLGLPLLLGSLWAIVPGVIAALLMIIRTAFEDRMLNDELPGYTDYTARTRYRLLPGIW